VAVVTADEKTTCHLPYFLPAGATSGQTKEKLNQHCLLHYGEDLCSRVLDQLFVDLDMEAELDDRECKQVVGLVAEHWRHKALSLRAAHDKFPFDPKGDVETSLDGKPGGTWGPWRPLGTWYQGARPWGPWVDLANVPDDFHEHKQCWLPYDIDESTTYGDVSKLLHGDCVPTYGEELCSSIMSELFKDMDLNAAYDRSQCPQMEGLILEHFHHQTSRVAHALGQRASLLEDSSAVVAKRHLESSMGSKHNCPPKQC
jgi:hypothetical protein